jgi:hypothetical protein
MAALLALPVAAGNVMPLEKFLGQRIDLLDASARNLYRSYAFALVDLLTRRPNGAEHLVRFIIGLPASGSDPLAELRRHFPETFPEEGAEKTWQNQIIRLATNQPYQLLGSAETQRRLDETLRLKISDRGAEKSYDLTQFQIYLKHKAARKSLSALALDLSSLGTRAHPVYAPIIAEYAHIIALLQRGQTLSVPKRLERLADSRKAIAAQMRKIDDYLNWFEATNLAAPSGAFRDYMKAAERAAEPVRPKRDPISVYLTAIETQFER